MSLHAYNDGKRRRDKSSVISRNPPFLITCSKICISGECKGTLPRVRYVNSEFETCFGHAASWIRGRSINVLTGMLTSPHLFLELCKYATHATEPQASAMFRCMLVRRSQKISRDFRLTLYSANGTAISTSITIAVLPNYSKKLRGNSVAVMTLECLKGQAEDNE